MVTGASARGSTVRRRSSTPPQGSRRTARRRRRYAPAPPQSFSGPAPDSSPLSNPPCVAFNFVDVHVAQVTTRARHRRRHLAEPPRERLVVVRLPLLQHQPGPPVG